MSLTFALCSTACVDVKEEYNKKINGPSRNKGRILRTRVGRMKKHVGGGSGKLIQPEKKRDCRCEREEARKEDDIRQSEKCVMMSFEM